MSLSRRTLKLHPAPTLNAALGAEAGDRQETHDGYQVRNITTGLRLARSTFARSAPLLPSSPGGARRTLCSGAAALPWEPARFKGANIVVEKPVDDAFEPRLVLALDELREAGRRGVWMRVPIEHSAAAAVAARHGFAFHHAEGSTAAQAC